MQNENDFILAAGANDLERLNHLMDMEEAQTPDTKSGTAARKLASLEAIRCDCPEALALLYKRGCQFNTGKHLTQFFHGTAYDMVQFLLSWGADPNESYCPWPVWTALEGAAALHSIPVIEALIDAGAELKNRRVLARAAGKGRLDVMRYLLDRGAPIDGVGTNPRLFNEEKNIFYYDEIVFRSALCEAAFYGQAEAVEFVLQRGADLSIKDTDGKSAVELAEMKGHKDCLDILRRYQEAKK
ncbi:ankyrin repeat-containing domain protein [Aspergillus multicolor]|uniref:ankyrin repeat domain-containing protein n=1 Tax=Aspergillus multicolor TaxID=41759 RepID=UPI003CCDDF78